jgi:hypothetical protein
MYIWGMRTGDGWIRRTRVGRILIYCMAIRVLKVRVLKVEKEEEGGMFD